MTSEKTNVLGAARTTGRRTWHRTLGVIAASVIGLTANGCSSDDAVDSAPDTQATLSTQPDPAPATEPATTDPEPTASAVLLDVVLDLNSTPETGTFEVTEGGAEFGCTAGRLYLSTTDMNTSIMTCEDGVRTGEFTVAIDPTMTEEDRFVGTWTIVSGTGDFEGLTGGGEIDDVRDTSVGSIIGTRTGEIEYVDGHGRVLLSRGVVMVV